ncbi:hypothetical protein EDD16DRAFT_297563 [Pisolithus croceorrhizus]|nr:hypothetical protein EDD16DRAFT_297563 [Pisolithus croceorrhizus]
MVMTLSREVVLRTDMWSVDPFICSRDGGRGHRMFEVGEDREEKKKHTLSKYAGSVYICLEKEVETKVIRRGEGRWLELYEPWETRRGHLTVVLSIKLPVLPPKALRCEVRRVVNYSYMAPGRIKKWIKSLPLVSGSDSHRTDQSDDTVTSALAPSATEATESD